MTFPKPNEVTKVAVVGAGTIGASWAAWFLGRGLTVAVTDPLHGRDQFLHDYVAKAWPALVRIGAAREAEPAFDRLSFSPELEEVLDGASVVQENALERLDLKQSLLARIDAALPPDRLIASSTSGFKASELQQTMAHPERLVIGHPFNPPHLIPLVEVVGGEKTDPSAVAWAMEFYRAVGKHPIHVKKEVPAHISNRLQAALWREAVHLVAEGVGTVEDVDAAIAYGPGLRWALMGPHMIFHLAGGEGGMHHFLDHLGPPMESWWKSLGQPSLTPEVNEALVAGVEAEAGSRSMADLAAERDARLIALLDVLGLARDKA
ncbi:3-hydroxyacyl-CoA dehydrogenase NAD-binding domain-containing protein [Enterovirga rhinocerotis]|uniref:3-hydroxyacyl-CoA dehydrogenase n=1 Tax=Enterovirga rhinocerotis TaxID=1339210 RepID=A0A4R7BXU5_9HYPH|nr:3-hydroxyacyl-CoA dehydrogenase NAD-binding domain-containing protein [Enterovirga rhinocerotis]TDR89555.1 3-hydroxyacyl-CoA dehydrogenase [Enterovirga rhinocerotis]